MYHRTGIIYTVHDYVLIWYCIDFSIFQHVSLELASLVELNHLLQYVTAEARLSAIGMCSCDLQSTECAPSLRHCGLSSIHFLMQRGARRATKLIRWVMPHGSQDVLMLLFFCKALWTAGWGLAVVGRKYSAHRTKVEKYSVDQLSLAGVGLSIKEQIALKSR